MGPLPAQVVAAVNRRGQHRPPLSPAPKPGPSTADQPPAPSTLPAPPPPMARRTRAQAPACAEVLAITERLADVGVPGAALRPIVEWAMIVDAGLDPDCWCADCDEARRQVMFDATGNFAAYITRFMILCPTCGNKRCPHATNHANACTGSNAPGQAGSNYGARQ